MVDLFGAGLDREALASFCAQFPQMKKLIRKVEQTVRHEWRQAEWAGTVKSVFEEIYDFSPPEPRRRERLDGIRDALDDWTGVQPEGVPLDRMVCRKVDAFCTLAERIFRAFPTMGEVFVDGRPSLCDALLTAGVREGRRKGTLEYRWSHPVALLPVYELVWALGQAPDAGAGGPGWADAERVLYHGALYSRFVEQCSFSQPYKGKLYRFQLNEDACAIIGTPAEQIYALHAISPQRLTEKICYSVRELLQDRARPVTLRFVLAGRIDDDRLEELTELLTAELRAGEFRRLTDGLALQITVCDSLCKKVPEPKSEENLTIRWCVLPDVDVGSNEVLRQEIFEQYDAAFFIDLAALYRPKFQEFRLPDRMPVFLRKPFCQERCYGDDFRAAWRHISYLADYFREQSAAYSMRCSAQRLDLNATLLRRITALYKEWAYGEPRVSYIYLAHHEIFKRDASKYENISRIEDYDGAALAIVRHSNRPGELLKAVRRPELFPITLWQLLKSVRSDISRDLLQYVKNRRAEYFPGIDQEWQLIYALRRVYLVLKMEPDIVYRDTLDFYCLVDRGELASLFQENCLALDKCSEALRQMGTHLFTRLWGRVRKSVDGGMTDYTAALHSALSKALYGRSCSLEHILLWHLYENKILAKKKLVLIEDISQKEYARILEQVAELSLRASDQPEDKHFYAHLVSNADLGRLGIIDMQQDVELYQYYYPLKGGAPNINRVLVLLKKSYVQIAEACVYLGYTDSVLYSNAVTQSGGV